MKNEAKEIIYDENNLNHNYFKKAFFSRLKLNILIIILSIAAFIIEFFYRDPLFNLFTFLTYIKLKLNQYNLSY